MIKHASNILSKDYLKIPLSKFPWLNFKYSNLRKLEEPFNLFYKRELWFFFRCCSEAVYVHAKVDLASQISRAHVEFCRRLVTALAVEDVLIFIKDELHYLVLKDHVHRDVG